MKKLKWIVLIFALIALISILSGCGKKEELVDPHEGQVLVNDGFEDVWITPVEGVEVNPLTKEDFVTVNEQPVYKGTEFSVKKGIDVSEWNFDIDWQKVAATDVKFAMVRVGRRGTSEGGLAPDKYYLQNIEGALNNGLEVGVYFFSQAVNVQEAIEEADYTVSLIKDFNIELPIYFDWENDEADWRNHDISFTTMTDCAVAFCERIKAAGYTPGVYFGIRQGYYAYDLGRLSDYSFWVTNPGDFQKFYYAGDIWQYSIDQAAIDGIETTVDLNFMFIPNEPAEVPAE